MLVDLVIRPGRAARCNARGARLLAFLVPVCGAVVTASCGEDTRAPRITNFDGPMDVAFTCHGPMRLRSGGSDEVSMAQPVAGCTLDTPEERVAAGQADRQGAPSLFGFVLQRTEGTVVMSEIDPRLGAGVVDSDPLTPGYNPIPVGTLPVGITTEPGGCYMVTANAGSCDLSRIDVASAAAVGQLAKVNRQPVVAGDGRPLRARPAAIAGRPDGGAAAVGFDCAEGDARLRGADGIVYVSYPGCHLVAAVNWWTGAVVGGVDLSQGTPAVVQPAQALACRSECAGAADDAPAPGAGQARPAALAVSPDGSTLVIGSQNSAEVVVADLAADGLPQNPRTVRLEGSIGVSRIAISAPRVLGSGHEFVFAYVIASDGTIRVVRLRGPADAAQSLDQDELVECDTQVDPRQLVDRPDLWSDELFTACMVVNGPRTPPRRPRGPGGAPRPPGIQLRPDTADVVPLDIAFAAVEQEATSTSSNRPPLLSGYFAYVSGSDGAVYVINVDDRSYPDFRRSGDSPLAVVPPLALPHQVRDGLGRRSEVATSCLYNGDATALFGPRLGSAEEPAGVPVHASKAHLLPELREVTCVADPGNPRPVSELSMAAEVAGREWSFPDWAAVRNELWNIEWEGALSLQRSNFPAPVVRLAALVAEAGSLLLEDPGAPFCALGAAPYDVVEFGGCVPNRSGECGVDEVCHVPADAVSRIGMCLPGDRVDELGAVCRDFIASRRRYSVVETHDDRLRLVPRRRVLATTPLDGCASVAQCTQLAEQESRLRRPEDPVQSIAPAPGEPVPRSYSWTCAADPTRSLQGTPARCQMTCQSSDDCEQGWSCHEGFCVEAPLPPPECLVNLQPYVVRAGEAFAVVGSASGFLHDRMRDPVTGQCVADPAAHPLDVGRLPLRAPPCPDGGDLLGAAGPNPCSTRVEHLDRRRPVIYEDGLCRIGGEQVVPLELPAVRFRNRSLGFHMVHTETTGDLQCNGDAAGTQPAFSPVAAGYRLLIGIVGGFAPYRVLGNSTARPARLSLDPIGRLWVIDQGDTTTNTGTFRGRVFRLNPQSESELEDLN